MFCASVAVRRAAGKRTNPNVYRSLVDGRFIKVAPEIRSGVRFIDDRVCAISLIEIEYFLGEIVYGAKTIVRTIHSMNQYRRH